MTPCDVEALKRCLEENKGDRTKVGVRGVACAREREFA